MAVNLKPPGRLNPVPGLRLASIAAGIYKKRSRDDLTLICAPEDAVCAAVFTKNAFRAAPVAVAESHIAAASPRVFVINAGNANAGTGERGLRDARAVCTDVAKLVGCAATDVLPFSTGVIGEYLPVDRVRDALPPLCARLREDAWLECGHAIMTTDTVAKGCSETVRIGSAQVTVTGIAKGAGMIRPDMATMLAFLGTDAAVSREFLKDMLERAVNRSFNRICVDGDTSTNDACALLATGRADMPVIRDATSPGAGELQAALERVCATLAQAIVRDGEGATKFITVRVEQGRDAAECLRIANAIATSPLIKTAFYASDPNWGRILAAVGRSGPHDLDIARVAVHLDEVCIVAAGERAADYTEQAGQQVLSRAEIVLRVVLGRGHADEQVWTCDLSHEYVTINAEYRT